MIVALFGKRIKDEKIEGFNNMIKLLSESDFEIIIHEKLMNEIKSIEEIDKPNWETFNSQESLKDRVNMLISIGGDGTLLDTILLVNNLDIPVLGINTGRLGFLSTTSIEEIEIAINALKNKDYEIEKRAMLKIENKDGLFLTDNIALNEVSILKGDTASMITIHVSLNGNHLNSYWTDGLIISTATGSTAYSLSCGGPILMPGGGNFVLTPIAPHNLNVRPIVVNDNSILDIQIESRSERNLIALDSRSFEIHSNQKFTISKAENEFNIVQLNNTSFIQSLKNKLNWGLDKRNN